MTASNISRGPAGDCCVLCGRVGINLPDDHGCTPNAAPPPRPDHGPDWVDLFNRAQEPTRPKVDWVGVWNKAIVDPANANHDKLIAARLAGICRRVASTPKGARDTEIRWAAYKLMEIEAETGKAIPPNAITLVVKAARATGQPDKDIRRALREYMK